MDSPLFWLAVVVLAAAGAFALGRGHRLRPIFATAPSVITVLSAAASVALLLGSFVAAPAIRPDGYTLAAANLDQLIGHAGCGIADDVQVLLDVPGGTLTQASTSGSASGFAWDSRVRDASGVAELTSPWFTVPLLRPDQQLAVPVSGRVADRTTVTLEFALAGRPLATVAPQGPPRPDPSFDTTGRPLPAAGEPTQPRELSVDANQVPAGAAQVRVLASDSATDPDGWLAITGPPRLREIVPLTDYLDGRGPVLVDWPISFLLPCQLDTPRVADGLAQAPVAIVQTSHRYPSAALASDPGAGGNFTALRSQGRLVEVPTRLRHNPDLEWGHLLLIGYGMPRDSYTLTQIG